MSINFLKTGFILLLLLSSCREVAVPDSEADFSGKISGLNAYSTLGVEKLGVIEIQENKENFPRKITVTITAKTKIIKADKRRSFEALKKEQQAKIWLKNKNQSLLNAQLTATHVQLTDQE